MKIDPINPEKKLLREAAKVLREGNLVAFPTETVYGLGADGYNPKAVLKVFKAKGRPSDNPLILHVNSLRMFEDVVKDPPNLVYDLISKVWPGPLTVVLRKSEKVPHEVTAGLNTVAVRCPGHPVALGLIEELGKPIAAPSANLSGRPSPTNAKHVLQDLGGRIELLLDGGETFFGVESTVLDMTTDPPTLLRPGPIAVEDIEKILGIRVTIPEFARGLSYAGEARSPGVKYRHYSPKKPMVLIEISDYSDLRRYADIVLGFAKKLVSSGKSVIILASDETAAYYEGFRVVVLGPRMNIYRIAKNLFNALRIADALPGDVIVAEAYEEIGVGLAIMNRLRKASSEIIRF
jgi:L-threonylcarbamoyladenylate synthase